jgi:hypothetical protein
MNARTSPARLRAVPLDAEPAQDRTTQMAARSFAHAHAVHQDFLVQWYRVLVAAMHLGFLVAFAALVELRLPLPAALAAASITVAAHHVLSGRLMRMVLSRQADVDWSQKQVLVLEQLLPPDDRLFTRFKLYQDAKTGSIGERQRAVLAREPATQAQVESYFSSHASPSRGKASRLLDAMRLLGLGVAVLSVLAAALH